MCVHALLGATGLAAGGTGFPELFPLAMHLELPVEPRPYIQKYAAVARWNTSSVSALLLLWATVKRLEFSLSSQKEASLLFWGRGILEGARTPRHIKEKTLLRHTVSWWHMCPCEEVCPAPLTWIILWAAYFSSIILLRGVGKIVRTVLCSRCDRSNNNPQHLHSLLPDRPCDKHYISFGLLHDSITCCHTIWRGKEARKDSAMLLKEWKRGPWAMDGKHKAAFQFSPLHWKRLGCGQQTEQFPFPPTSLKLLPCWF